MRRHRPALRSALGLALAVATAGCGKSEPAAPAPSAAEHPAGPAPGGPMRPWPERAFRKFGKLGYGEPGGALDRELATRLLAAAHPPAVLEGADVSRAVEGQAVTAVVVLRWKDPAGAAQTTTVRSTVAERGHQATTIAAPASSPVEGERAEAVTAAMVRFWDDLRSQMGRNRSTPDQTRWVRTAIAYMDRTGLSHQGSNRAATLGRAILERLRPGATHRETAVKPGPAGGSRLVVEISVLGASGTPPAPATTVVRVVLVADALAEATVLAAGGAEPTPAQVEALQAFLRTYWNDLLVAMDRTEPNPLAPGTGLGAPRR